MRFRKGVSRLTTEDLTNILGHQYKVQGKGIIERRINAFAADVVVPRLPQWLAPNSITVIGFLVHAFFAMVLMCSRFHSYFYTEEIKSAYLILYAISLLFYQIMDSADGAQAKRTGNSTPLGELMDHGCDAMTMCFVINTLSCIFRLSFFLYRHITIFILLNSCFCLTHLLSYTRGFVSFYSIDAIEGQWAVIIFTLIVAYTGVDSLWDEILQFSNLVFVVGRTLEWGDILFGVIVLIGVIVILRNVFLILNQRTTTEGYSVLPPLVAVLYTSVIAVICTMSGELYFYKFMFSVTMLILMIPYVKITWLLLISYISKSEFPFWDTYLLYNTLLAIAQLIIFNTGFVVNFLKYSIFFYAVYILLTLAILDFIFFAYTNIRLMAIALGISVFKVKQYSLS